MTTEELREIVSAVMQELESSGVDFDYTIQTAEDTDLVFVIRGNAPDYQGKVITWKGLLDIITAQATQAKNDAETAKNAANAILTQVTSKESNVSTMKSEVSEIKASVETTKSQVEGMKNAVETTKGQVETMKTSIETTKEEVETMKTSVETSKSQVEANKSQVETMKTSIETTKSEVETLKGQAETAQQGAEGARDTAVAAKNAVATMKSSVEQTVSDFNTLAAEKKSEVQGVYQNDFNELKGDLYDFYGIGKNIYNNNTSNKRNGIYMTTSMGNVKADASYGTVSFPIDATKGSISVNKAYTFIHFFDKEIDVNSLVVGSDTSGYISGVIAQSSPLANITIPTNAKCVVISTGINKFNTLQVEYGSEITSYEPYVKGINGNKIVDKTIPLSKLEEIPSQDYDNSIYELPFINNKRLCCNKVNDGGTACYIGVDTKGIPNKIVSKFIMEEGTSSGTVALILQKNGLNKVSDITNGSFHCVITATGVAVNILKDNGYLTNPIDINLTHPLLMDGVTENTVTIEVSGNDITLTINNGTYTDTYNGTFAYETYNLSDFIGRYAQIEHYCSGDRNNKSMPMFTYWEVAGTNIFVNPKDNFSRPNGLLDRTPNGYEYHVFTNANDGY